MKSPWPTKKLGEICEIRMGETLIEKDLTGEGIPVYSADSLEVPWGFTSNNRLRFYKGSIIIGARGTIGSVKLPTDEIFTATQTTIVLTPKIKEITSTFLYYFLRKINFKSIQGGTGIPMLTVGTLSSFQIPIPPLPIQQKIVKILDTIQEAIDIHDKIIEKTKELKKSLMAELFKYGGPSFRKGRKLKKTEIGEIPEDWEVVRLGDKKIAEIKYGKGKPPEGGKIPVIGSSGIYDWTNKALIEKPTIVIGRKGTAGIPHLSMLPCWPSDTAFYLDLNLEKINAKFLYEYILFKPLSGEHAKTTLPSLRREDLENFKIPLPSLPEQQEIAEILQTVDQKIDIERRKKELYEELFKTMLNKIMNQEIDVESVDF